MKSFTKKFFAIISLFLAPALVLNALTISPAREELTADKGEAISKTFLIINDQDTEQTFYTSVEAFDSQGESGTPNFTKATEGLPTWVTVTDKVTIKPGERVSLPYTISVPADAQSGGHFAAIFLSTVPPSADSSQVSVGAKVGMLILLKVTGDVKEEGGVSSFTIKGDTKTLSSLPVDFEYRFTNSGNDRVKPLGDIVITNTLGFEVTKINANKTEGNVLPGSTRKFEARLGSYEAPAASAPFFEHVTYQMNNFALGMYTATLSLSFGNEGKSESSITYFMFPWQLLVVVLVSLLVVILALTLALKKYNQWIIKQAQKASGK
ncbi:MAG: hypothetical protein RI935_151 [Candidatus Parcubacteria bacterium]|jgi:hypothetical protein